ncbi:hypothetical protein VSDG_00637 [Cytospora chrysosperma]|uniref:Uncharacterized protein n=1 Tax=Cytospora chrysosperma TaxID=252740 RepID=A0A423WNN4_CYTCH|nr:hypothetical protein VSDG_00637 [Valsa sordida]
MESPDKFSTAHAPLLAESERDSEDGLPTMFHEKAYGKKQPPAKEAIKEYHRHSFDGSLGLETKYTGEPRPEVEEAWGHLFKNYNLRFTAEEMRKLNRTDNPIELRNGGGYFGQLSAYHHLHCLSMLRKVLWHDMYNVSIPDLRSHADHCINDIRQSLMCHADLSVVTFWWHPEMRKPMPNFHIDQTCVNWDALDAWASKRSFSIFDQKTLVHPQLGLSFPMVDGEIQVHGTPDYASSQAHVLASVVGHQVSFVQADPIEYLSGGAAGQKFDFIVFGYSIWYFSSPHILTRTLQEACQYSQSVLIAEYSLSASLPAQVPHLLAALADNALESFRGEESKRNIRCALSPRQITDLAAEIGWVLAKEEIATPLPKQIDAKMEVRMVIKSRLFRADLDDVVSRMGPKIGIMLHSMIDAVTASVERLEGGLDNARNMDVWIARFEKRL